MKTADQLLRMARDRGKDAPEFAADLERIAAEARSQVASEVRLREAAEERMRVAEQKASEAILAAEQAKVVAAQAEAALATAQASERGARELLAEARKDLVARVADIAEARNRDVEKEAVIARMHEERAAALSDAIVLRNELAGSRAALERSEAALLVERSRANPEPVLPRAPASYEARIVERNEFGDAHRIEITPKVQLNG